MDNSLLLVQAASGLESLMVGTRGAVLKDSTVAQISAAIYYKASVVSKLTTNKVFQTKFTKTLFDQIQNDFGDFIDAKARTSPKSLHHVYEWKRVGDKDARLFKLNKVSQNGLSFKIDFEYLPSKALVPDNFGKARHVFQNKAAVMELGMPIRISPKSAERLAFEVRGSTVFMPKGASVTVRNPGGAKARNQFKLNYSRWFSGALVSNSIKRSGFQRMFNSSMTKALKVPGDIKKVKYSFNANSINVQAESALTAAFGTAI